MTSSALVGRRFLLYCAKEPDIFCGNPFAQRTRVRQILYVANHQKDSMITSWRIT